MLEHLPASALVQTQPLFKMGALVMTQGINKLVSDSEDFSKFVVESLNRHARADWGDLSEDDKDENNFSLNKHLRIFSAYKYNEDVRIWIITEADRSVTTILLPSEY